jgi:CBS domain-containing protein
MKANDIMTTPVVTVSPVATVREIAELLLERRISAVPVVEEGRLVGLVSEGDLLHRYEIGTDRDRPERSWWRGLIGGEPGEAAAKYVKSHAMHARDVMTRDVITVNVDTSIAAIAAVLEAHRIKRVPVLRDGHPVGIVGRANLIQALAAHPHPTEKPRRTRSDDSIRRELLAELESQPWWRSSASSVTVTDGVVHYWGLLDYGDQTDAARVAAENVPGVRKVEDHRMRIADLPSMV